MISWAMLAMFSWSKAPGLATHRIAISTGLGFSNAVTSARRQSLAYRGICCIAARSSDARCCDKIHCMRPICLSSREANKFTVAASASSVAIMKKKIGARKSASRLPAAPFRPRGESHRWRSPSGTHAKSYPEGDEAITAVWQVTQMPYATSRTSAGRPTLRKSTRINASCVTTHCQTRLNPDSWRFVASTSKRNAHATITTSENKGHATNPRCADAEANPRSNPSRCDSVEFASTLVAECRSSTRRRPYFSRFARHNIQLLTKSCVFTKK